MEQSNGLLACGFVDFGGTMCKLNNLNIRLGKKKSIIFLVDGTIKLDHLKLEIGQKRPELANRSGVLFHQDNARPQTSVVTHQNLLELGWEVLMHPPYIPDLALSDYHLFLALQNFLSGKKLGSREVWENRLLDVFAKKCQDFYARGIMKLPLKWQQIIQQSGAYLTQIGQSEGC
ncbi:histone-lysine N-methyltransferase SETMAR [Trichonephila clavipes]|nr:histone-lysine N-methyltransferase SETMAR [Trichonephila clavipes]